MKSFKLDHDPKIKSGFKTPEYYFENFSDQVLFQISKKEPKVIALHKRRSLKFLVAASIAVILMSIPFLKHQKENHLENIDVTSLENYLTTHLSQYELVSLLEQQDIKTIDFEMPILEEDLEYFLIKNDHIELYLNE